MGSRRLKLCLQFMKGNFPAYAGAIFSMLMTVILGFVNPRIIGWTIDSFIGNEPLNAPGVIESFITGLGGRDFMRHSLWICALAMLLVTLLSGLFSFLNGRLSAVASESIAKTMRDRLYRHLQFLSYNYHVKAETGDLIQRCTSDVETVRRFLSGQLVQIVRSVAMITFALFMMVPMSLKLSLIAVSIGPVIAFFSYKYFKNIIKYFTIVDESEGAMSATLQENLTGMRVVRAFGRQKYEIEKFENKVVDFRTKSLRLSKLFSNYWSYSDYMSFIQNGLTSFFAIWFAIRGEITVGTVIVFTSYAGMISWPIRSLGRVLSDMGKAMVSIERIDQILREPDEMQEEGKVTPPLDKDIVFDNVGFYYEKNKPILKGLSFTVKAGETVAILGATGSGKSSIMHLLHRFYDYQKGSIKIGGVELNTIDKKHLRSHIGLILQEPFLYSKTVYENVAIVDPTLPEETVFEAARTAALHDVVMGFDEGYKTIVGERGVTLSGGQKQRLSIARTLLKDNDVLIFDDSLSAVDTETDAQIRKALGERDKKSTTFIISHRLTTLQEADKIIVLGDGVVDDIGTHFELIKRDGLYKRIFEIQSELESEME